MKVKFTFRTAGSEIEHLDYTKVDPSKPIPDQLFDLIDRFNESLRPGEKPRTVTGIVTSVKDTRKRGIDPQEPGSQAHIKKSRIQLAREEVAKAKSDAAAKEAFSGWPFEHSGKKKE